MGGVKFSERDSGSGNRVVLRSSVQVLGMVTFYLLIYNTSFGVRFLRVIERLSVCYNVVVSL